MERKQTTNLLQGASIARDAVKNIFPAMAAMVMVLIYNLADTFFIGQTRQDILVAAVSLATPVFLVLMAIGNLFGVGGTSLISRSLGQGRTAYAKKVCSFCMWSCVGVGVILAALALLFINPILALIGASADTWAPTQTYLSIVFLGGPFVLISNCYSNILRAEGQASKAMMGRSLATAQHHLGSYHDLRIRLGHCRSSDCNRHRKHHGSRILHSLFLARVVLIKHPLAPIFP